MEGLEELLRSFGGLTVEDPTNTGSTSESTIDDQPNSSGSRDSDSCDDRKYESAPWMKQFTFIDILLPIHDAIFPQFCGTVLSPILFPFSIMLMTMYTALSTVKSLIMAMKRNILSFSMRSIQIIMDTFRRENG